MRNYYLKLIFSPFLFTLSFIFLYRYNILVNIIVSLIFIFLIEFFTLTGYKYKDYTFKLLIYMISFLIIFFILNNLNLTKIQILTVSFYAIMIQNFIFLNTFYEEKVI